MGYNLPIMKIHTPLFIIGLVTFVTPFLGLPSSIENLIIAAYGIAIMLIVSTIRLSDKKAFSENPEMENIEETIKKEITVEEDVQDDSNDQLNAEETKEGLQE